MAWEHPGWYLTADLAAARGITVQAVVTAVHRGAATVPAPDVRDGGLMRWRADRADVLAFLNAPREEDPERARALVAELIGRLGSVAAVTRATGVGDDTLRRIRDGHAVSVRAATAQALESALAGIPGRPLGGDAAGIWRRREQVEANRPVDRA
jgi:hypothetical protein